jgi:GNAT superfamily N-acetyltransferase
MGDSWQWVEAARERHFGGEILGYRLERVDPDTYWDVHEAELRRHFPAEAYFDVRALSGPRRAEAAARLTAAEGADRLADHWLVRAGDGALAGTFTTEQRRADTFELFHVTIHPDHRRRGLYSEILRRVLAYADELGFSTTVSVHAPSNNAVLIAHLKAGFRIAALEVNRLYGPSVQLVYFHDPELLKAFEYRCGLAVMDGTLHAAGAGHFGLLDDQFAAARGRAAGGGGERARAEPAN